MNVGRLFRLRNFGFPKFGPSLPIADSPGLAITDSLNYMSGETARTVWGVVTPHKSADATGRHQLPRPMVGEPVAYATGSRTKGPRDRTCAVY